MKKLIKYIKITILIIIITYVSLINYESYKSRINYSDKLYSVDVYKGRVLVRSTVLTKYPDIINNSITLLNNQNTPITYTDHKIIIKEVKELN
jgi:hypothetical protein